MGVELTHAPAWDKARVEMPKAGLRDRFGAYNHCDRRLFIR
jgi:hypothetical protein